MGNLLNRGESFIWNDPLSNRGDDLINYQASLVESRNIGDEIYCPTSAFDINVANCIYSFLWSDIGNTYDLFSRRYSWINPDQFQMLMVLHTLMGTPTPNDSENWAQFNNEFMEGHNSLIGMSDSTCGDPLVFDLASLYDFHRKNVASFTLAQRRENYFYFRSYFRPQLTAPISQIRGSILKGQIDKLIDRIDSPTQGAHGEILHHEQIHIHFGGNKPSALNLDGSWKHENIGFTIPDNICELLCAWGFDLPNEYY